MIKSIFSAVIGALRSSNQKMNSKLNYKGDTVENWQTQLVYDPLPALLSSKNEALRYFVNHDLLEKNVLLGPLWEWIVNI